MSGNYSRRKGMKNEYLVRDALRGEGYEADRVPASGAAQGFKGDVRFKKNGNTYVAEVKVRGNDFKRVYELYDTYQENGMFATAVSTEDGLKCISIAKTMSAVMDNTTIYPPSRPFEVEKIGSRGIKKLLKCQELIGTSDVLVVRSDRKPFLYIRYR